MKTFSKAITLFILFLIGLQSASNAQEKGYDAKKLDANVRLDKEANTIDGYVSMYGIAQPGLTKILQHAKGLTVDSVFVNNIKATVEWLDTSIGAYNVTGFGTVSDSFAVKTYYHGIGTSEGGASPWGGVQNDGKMMYAMGVGFHASYISCTRHWLPCYDLPDDKLDTVYLGIGYELPDNAVSNGIGIGGWEVSHSNRQGSIYKVSHPIATYLLTFAVGPFVYATSSDKKFPPREIACYPEDSAKAQLLLDTKITPALNYFESIFAPYPFEKVGYVVAPTGSMEHQTMITLIKQALDTASTTAIHELAHMWWGDWVTCKDFNDPWLNEGFATFCESLFLERFKGRASYISKQKSNISGAMASGSSVPLYGTPMSTGTSSNYPYAVLYQKGAAVVGMLRYFLGDSLFFPALRYYGAQHAYDNASSFDLQKDFETSTGQDLGWFFKKWVFGKGFPTIKANWSRNGGSVTMYFEQTQNAQTIGYFRLPFVIEARTKTGDTARQVVWMDSTQFSQGYFTIPFTPDTVIIDPEGQVIKRITGQVQLGVDDATPTEWKYPTYELRMSPNPNGSNRINIEFYRPSFVHNTRDHPSAFDPYYWIFTPNHTKKIELLIYDAVGNQKEVITSVSSTNDSRVFSASHNLPSGSYTIIAKLGSQILAQGRFTVAK